MNRLFRSGRVVYRQLTQSSLLCQRTLLLPCERRPLGLPTTIRLFSAVADDSWEEYKKEDSVIWKETFEELKNHLNDLKKERGLSESDPTPYPEQLNLKNWVSRLRMYYKMNRFGNDPEDEKRIEMLESIGVYIDPRETSWESHFQKLEEFMAQNDNKFPYDFEADELDEEGLALLYWTKRQKTTYRSYRSGEIRSPTMEERIAKLEGIGFAWNKHEDSWMKRYENLVQYYKHHGDTLVPSRYTSDPGLAKWVTDQRSQYRMMRQGAPTGLSEERMKLLEKVNFQWDARQAKWEENYRELAEFVAMNGKGSLPSYQQSRLLRFWCNNQRKEYRKLLNGEPTLLAGKRKEMLDELGFPWVQKR